MFYILVIASLAAAMVNIEVTRSRRLSAMRNAALPPLDAKPARPSAAGSRGRPSLLRGLGIIGIVLAGLALGLFATDIVVERGWDPATVTIGAWSTNPRIGMNAVDPYALARLARTGEVPMAGNEGLVLTALTDDTGYRLLRSCTYRLSGPLPSSRFWTLTAVATSGEPEAGQARRWGFTSTTVIRDEAGAVVIESGPQARPGNWLPTPGSGPMSFVLRLYDTPLTANTNAVAGTALPAIVRLACEPATGGVR